MQYDDLTHNFSEARSVINNVMVKLEASKTNTVTPSESKLAEPKPLPAAGLDLKEPIANTV
ncbi:hypothetical protein L3V82_11340 [Thiotrichales bacterium 19S3-7]|nr:hypothetical protein [Thiotrichales bacterium 19S3-7]